MGSSTSPPDPATPKRQFRGIWLATVANLDWPSRPGLTPAAQQAELRGWLDLARRLRCNAVVVQVRPAADALWPSPYEPWSAVLTGGQGGHPGYDPLGFLVTEAHARNLELHAWFNPYRIANHADPGRLVADHPARRNPDWVVAYAGRLYYDPGIPAVRSFVQDAMLDAVTHYDIDAVHWDDYFYPYPVAGQAFADHATFARYGAGFGSVEAWRRHNVDRLVEQMSDRLRAVKPWVRFGISPFGIWRNATTDPLGSRTAGLQSYDAIHADTRHWVREQWVDYVAPQLYWHLGHPAADYAELVRWWSETVSGTTVELIVGQSTYRAGAAGQDPAWQNPAELSRHLHLHRAYPQVRGDLQFSAKDVRADRLGAVSRLVAEHYSRPALAPVAAGRGGTPAPGTAPPPPAVTAAVRTPTGVRLDWLPAPGSTPTAYAVYRLAGTDAADPTMLDDARHLLAAVRATGAGDSYADATAAAGSAYTYLVTALDRQHRESPPGPARVLTAGSDAFSVIVDNDTPGGFTASAAWGTSRWSAGRYGADYRYTTAQPVSDPAWFTVTVPATGNYRVEVWHPAASGYHPGAPHLVQTTTGLVTRPVDQRADGGRWRELGVFPLAAGRRPVVGVSRWAPAGGHIIADAVRLTRVP
ncbi:family 10 glycosylhydrolase [Micromonospora sp. NBC_01813]|uniref:family 10 glycosylhydrolase n=1 Tax=Micromonospora sp. NBC_01813 TaxID=2975988 RepID=UPI002DD9700D|nr:family 10 glycosylhydrolase [Micromonospora sp. NBC_01813]WSA10656.1 family 10 glycosylhydrolase [Micromonospora sp. NBC_01813]